MITYTSATKKIAEEAFQAALLGDLDKVKQLAGHTFHLETCDEKGIHQDCYLSLLKSFRSSPFHHTSKM